MSNPIQGFKTKSGNRKYDYLALENLPETDPDDLALEVEEAKENIEAKKANIDGSYSSMTVGNAEQLVATVGEEDNAPYNFRTSGGTIDIGDREEDMVVGGTVCWNQLINNGDFANGTNGWSVTGHEDYGIENGVFHFLPNATYGRVYKVLPSKPLKANHVFLGIARLKSDSSLSNVQLTIGDNVNFTRGKTHTISDTWKTYSIMIRESTVAISNNHAVSVRSSATSDFGTIYVDSYALYDLTQMFGSTIADYIYNLEQANEGDGVAWFKKLFPKDYYEYDEGTLMSVKTSAHKMVGFNAFDVNTMLVSGYYINDADGNTKANGGDACTDFIPVIGGATYYIKSEQTVGAWGAWYDASKNFISGFTGYIATARDDQKRKTAPTNACYVRLTVKRTGSGNPNTFCINLSWDGERDGEYEPYEEHVYPLDSSLELRGIPKLDSANNLYYDGDTYESDGTVTRRFGVVDLGTLTYSRSSIVTNGFVATGGIPSDFPLAPSTDAVPNWFCPKYAITSNRALETASTDKAIAWRVSGTNKGIIIKDSSYSSIYEPFDAEAFKTAMSGVMLVYELAEPTTETAEPYQNPQIVNDFGTEEYVDERAVPIPVGHQTLYTANLRAKLEMSPDSPSADGEYIVKQTNGKNEYIALGSSTTMQSIMAKLPNPPSEDGTYTLKVTVANGTATYSWEE